MLHLADRIVAVSDCVKRDAVKYLHIDPEKIDVIYRSCDKVFHTPLSNEQLAVVRERYALPERYMLTVGTQSERKNISLIVEAMAEVQDKELQLVIVGRCTGNTEQIRHRIKSLGLEDRVIFLYGVPNDDLPAIYAGAEMFLNVSIYEGFSQSIIEAITMGVPVIASSGSSHEEAGGEGSIYVSPNDRVELKEAIERLAASSELRAEMAQKGRDYSSHFRSEVIAYNLINCYRRIGIDLNE
jgi:glycosyltransferase involved in cell wall biosynthesis